MHSSQHPSGDRFERIEYGGRYCDIRFADCHVVAIATEKVAQGCSYPGICDGGFVSPLLQEVNFASWSANLSSACIAGIVRLTKTLSAVKPGADTTWVTAEIYMWTAIEAGVALICACLPIIGPLIGLLREKITSYISSRSTRKATQDSTGDTSGGRSRSAGWTSVGSRGRHGDTESASNFELQSKSPHAIMRTDEYSFESYPHSEAERDQVVTV